MKITKKKEKERNRRKQKVYRLKLCPKRPKATDLVISGQHQIRVLLSEKMQSIRSSTRLLQRNRFSISNTLPRFTSSSSPSWSENESRRLGGFDSFRTKAVSFSSAVPPVSLANHSLLICFSDCRNAEDNQLPMEIQFQAQVFDKVFVLYRFFDMFGVTVRLRLGFFVFETSL